MISIIFLKESGPGANYLRFFLFNGFTNLAKLSLTCENNLKFVR